MSCSSKSCTKCRKTLSRDSFTKDKKRKDGLNLWCRSCTRANSAKQDSIRDHAARYHRNREAELLRKRGSLVVRDYNLRKLYSMTLVDFDQMLASQKGRCRICGTDKPGHKGRFCVDHNHNTGEVRGILCHKCNTALGLLQDSPSLLQSARDYLLKEGHYGES